ncbi:phosphoinositide 3-kinase regulatory subunit 6 [Gouania willdenowi]|uniref:Phosphoinositide 3-kinase regulatory subunit 6-like n=1 Tax=Gouania willdenowi TaxID=441366 RepID=A0A8C5E158_GOUWI|nr:phosphoinositide 3-kinase regulatory subunit 6-like [Gouania willdenowi]
MDNPTDDMTLQEINTLFGDLDSDGFQKGILTWILQKKLDVDPSSSIPLIRALIHQLRNKMMEANKIHEVKSYMSIIPMLHTLHYAVIQSGVVIPISLYQEVIKCLKELLKLPLPHSAVASNTLRSIEMEMKTPGVLYWKKVLAEQNLKSETFTQQEKVFVFADPAVFSDSMKAEIEACLKMSGFRKNVNNVQKRMIMHVLQAGMESIDRMELASALEALDEAAVKTFFNELNLAVTQSSKGGASTNEEYLNTLQRIYRDIMAASKEGPSSEGDDGFLSSTTLPFPDFNFLLWNENDELCELWNQLSKFTFGTQCSEDDETNDKRDSGIEADLKESSPNKTQDKLKRRGALKPQRSKDKLTLVNEKMEKTMGSTRSSDMSRTAKVVFMGDDRVLGRLTNAYHSIQKKESKHNLLTKKLNLQLYYIPVTDDSSVYSHGDTLPNGDKMSLASHLGQIDPWYQRNILSLVDPISNPADVPSVSDEPSQLNLYVLDTLCYYLRCGTQPANLPLYTVKMISDVEVEEVFVSHLHANIPGSVENAPKKKFMSRRGSNQTPPEAVVLVSCKKLTISQRRDQAITSLRTSGLTITSKPSASTSAQDSLAICFDCLKPEYKGFQAKSIKVEATAHWRFSVCLDRDSRRTNHNVKSIEVAPCLDPGSDIRPLHSFSRELPLSKYLDNVLSLPINTFTGLSM